MKRKIIIAAAVLLIGAGALGGWVWYRSSVIPERQLDEAHDRQIELFAQIKPEFSASDSAVTPLEPAESVNSAAVGWITIPDTHIDYPIAQAEDNDFYLHHGFDGQETDCGCPFLDYRCERGFTGFNSIVYGHHMKHQRMFADIALFKNQSYLRSHPTGTLTLADGAHTVRFFAYLNVHNQAPAYHAVFVTKAERDDYIDYLFAEARYTTGYTPDALKGSDSLHLLLLSTCTYEFTDARGILAGVIEPITE